MGMTDAEFIQLCQAANDWRYLTTCLSRGLNRHDTLEWSHKTTKADLDRWLMQTYGLDELEARMISNCSMDRETPFLRTMHGIRWTGSRPEPRFQDYPTISRAAVLGRGKELPVRAFAVRAGSEYLMVHAACAGRARALAFAWLRLSGQRDLSFTELRCRRWPALDGYPLTEHVEWYGSPGERSEATGGLPLSVPEPFLPKEK